MGIRSRRLTSAQRLWERCAIFFVARDSIIGDRSSAAALLVAGPSYIYNFEPNNFRTTIATEEFGVMHIATGG